MTIPLMILAVFAVGVGFVLGPACGSGFAHFLEKTLTEMPYELGEPIERPNFGLMAVSTAIALTGMGLAYYLYVAQPALPRKLAGSLQWSYRRVMLVRSTSTASTASST
jgi:NADH-quinone oxidoreductase subunit L